MPPSAESAALKTLFQTISANFPPSSANNVWLERALYDQVAQASTEPQDTTYADCTTNTTTSSPNTADPVPYLWIQPAPAPTPVTPSPTPTHALLFLHGGGFAFGSPSISHRKLAAHLANACNIPAASVDYRRTPSHPHPAALEDCIAVYRHLLTDRGIPGANIVLAGDSCGGGLASALALALHLMPQHNDLPKPAAVVALSPWYDHTNSGPSREYNAPHDAMTQRDFSNALAARYHAGRTAIDDPLVSPLFATPALIQAAAMPPHWISVAGCDTLRCDGEMMGEKLKGCGVEAEVRVGEGMQHVFEFMAGRAREADESVAAIGRWVRGKLGL